MEYENGRKGREGKGTRKGTRKFWARIAEILKDEEEEETSAADKSRTFVSVGSYPPTLKRHISDGEKFNRTSFIIGLYHRGGDKQEEEDNQDLDYAGNVTLNDDEGWFL